MTTNAAADRRDPVDLDTVDLTDAALYANGSPREIWRRLRRTDPVRWHPVGRDLGFWSVTSYAEAERVLRDNGTFTSERGTLLFLLGVDDPAGGRQMAATDPPRHRQMREPLQRALGPQPLRRQRDAIRAEVRALLAPAADGGVVDLAAVLAVLPMAVTGTMMALPRQDWPALTRLTTMAIAPDDPDFALPSGPDATLRSAHRDLFAYFHDIGEQRLRNPGDDLVSTLLAIEVDGVRQELDVVLSNSYSLLLGANVTTPHVAAAMLAEPAGAAALPELRAHPELLPIGIEEALRWASPANHFMRYARHDVVLGETTIPAGDPVVAWLGSANRDETVFPDPETFDIRRRPNRHIAFGVGPHYCVGHTVARVALRILLEEMLAGFTSIEPAGPPAYLHSNFVAGIKHLPVLARPA